MIDIVHQVNAGGTVLELEHASPAEIVDELVRVHGPGATADSHEEREFATRSCHAWGPPIQAAWGTSDDDLAAAIAAGVRHYAPETSGGR